MKKLILSFLLMSVAAVCMTGCNTINGVGRDVSSLGSDLSSGAKAVEKKM